jgi:hypothetical protein
MFPHFSSSQEYDFNTFSEMDVEIKFVGMQVNDSAPRQVIGKTRTYVQME